MRIRGLPIALLPLLVLACTADPTPAGGAATAEAGGEPAGDQWWSKTHLFQLDAAGAPQLCGVGRGSGMAAIGRTKAQAQARVEVMTFLQVTIAEISQPGQTGAQVRVDGTIQGLQIVAHHQEGRDHFALACIDLQTLGAQSPWKEQPELVAALAARGKKALGK